MSLYEILILCLIKYVYILSETALDDTSAFLADIFISEHISLILINLSLTNNLVRERVVKIARLRYNMLYLISRSEQFAQWYDTSSIGRHVFLFEPHFVFHNTISTYMNSFTATQIFDNLLYLLIFLYLGIIDDSIFINSEYFLLAGRERMDVFYSIAWIRKFLQQGTYTKIGTLVFEDCIGSTGTTFGVLFKIAPHLYMHLAYFSIGFPDITHHSQRLTHHFFDNGITK